MRAELRRQAADVAAAKCARRDATHNDNFEHLLWLHSCSGSLGVINIRRLSYLKKAGASAALAIALAKTYSQISRSTFLCQLPTRLNVLAILAQLIHCLYMQVCASCGTRDPDP